MIMITGGHCNRFVHMDWLRGGRRGGEKKETIFVEVMVWNSDFLACMIFQFASGACFMPIIAISGVVFRANDWYAVGCFVTHTFPSAQNGLINSEGSARDMGGGWSWGDPVQLTGCWKTLMGPKVNPPPPPPPSPQLPEFWSTGWHCAHHQQHLSR